MSHSIQHPGQTQGPIFSRRKKQQIVCFLKWLVFAWTLFYVVACVVLPVMAVMYIDAASQPIDTGIVNGMPEDPIVMPWASYLWLWAYCLFVVTFTGFWMWVLIAVPSLFVWFLLKD